MYFSFSYLLCFLLLSLKAIGKVSSGKYLEISHCPTQWEGGNQESSYLLHDLCSCTHGSSEDTLKVCRRMDKKLVYTSRAYNEKSVILPPVIHSTSDQEAFIIWQESNFNSSNRVIYGRPYHLLENQLGTTIKIASITSLLPLNITITTLSQDLLQVKWGASLNDRKQLKLDSLSSSRRSLTSVTPNTNSSFNLTDWKLGRTPSTQIVFINTVVVISTKIGEGYVTTSLEELSLTNGGRALIGNWWHYNSSNDSLVLRPTDTAHIGSYNFLIKAQHNLQGNIGYRFPIRVEGIPVSNKEPFISIEDFELSLGLGVMMSFSTVGAMCIYHCSCGRYTRNRYKRKNENDVVKDIIFNNTYKE